MLKSATAFALSLAAMAMAPSALAQESPLSLSTTTYLVEASAEGDKLLPPAAVVPGDMLEFTTSYENLSGQVISQFVVTNPVPANIAITPEAAAATEVSVDGGTVWGPLASLEVTAEDGSRRAATAADVTHLRWVIATLAPQAQGSVSYRGVVK